MNDMLVRRITEQVIKELQQEEAEMAPVPDRPERFGGMIPVGISARHIHLSREDLEVLFGAGHCLRKQRDLPQPGEFVAEETVTLRGPSMRSIEKVRVLGDLRLFTQIEISRTDAHLLGISPMVRKSGSLAGTPGAVVIGPCGCLQLPEGVIVANRHIHMNPADAELFQVRDGDEVDVRVVSEKPTIWGKVQIRVSSGANLYMHIDFDDANSVALDPKQAYTEILPEEVRKCCWQA